MINIKKIILKVTLFVRLLFSFLRFLNTFFFLFLLLFGSIAPLTTCSFFSSHFNNQQRTENNRKVFVLPPLRFFLCRLCKQQAINRILIRTRPVPDEIPINNSNPVDVFINGLPVVAVCSVVSTEGDAGGATAFGFYYFYYKVSLVS